MKGLVAIRKALKGIKKPDKAFNFLIREVWYERLQFWIIPFAKIPIWGLRYRGFWKIPLARLGLVQEPFKLGVKGSSLCFWTRSRDRYVLDEYFSNYDYSQIDYSDISTIVDIGAHIGVFSLDRSREVDEIHSYEPTSDTFEVLERNIAENSIDNIRTFNEAVSEKLNKVEISEGRRSLGNSVRKAQDSNGFQIKAVGLQQVVDRIENTSDKSLLKLDCEGSEFEIIQNADDSCIEFFDIVFMEWHAHAGDPKELEERLKNLGFKIKNIEDWRSEEGEHSDFGFILAERY